MRIWFVIIAAIMASANSVSADYVVGEFRGCLTNATHVVDAIVTAITKEHHARLKVLHHIKGTNAPTLLTGTALSCENAPPGALGMQMGKRYIIMLHQARLFEETTFWEVTKKDDGSLGCHLSDFHKRWLGASDTWVTLDEMTRLMTPQQLK